MAHIQQRLVSLSCHAVGLALCAARTDWQSFAGRCVDNAEVQDASQPRCWFLAVGQCGNPAPIDSTVVEYEFVGLNAGGFLSREFSVHMQYLLELHAALVGVSCVITAVLVYMSAKNLSHKGRAGRVFDCVGAGAGVGVWGLCPVCCLCLGGGGGGGWTFITLAELWTGKPFVMVMAVVVLATVSFICRFIHLGASAVVGCFQALACNTSVRAQPLSRTTARESRWQRSLHALHGPLPCLC